jgi:hypothetical protein
MEQEPEGSRQPLSHTRQVTIDALCEHFANDVMGVEEFERRVDSAHRAATVAELKDLLRDLPGSDLPAPVAGATKPAPPPQSRSYRISRAGHVKEREIVVAIMGGASRRGQWAPARKNFAFTLMGGAELDFREAVLGPGVTEVQVFAMWGGIEIIVPPGMNVESHGVGIMGGFDHFTEVAPDPDAPTLRVTGFACMGGVEITQRYPGESSRDARRRRRVTRKEQRRLHRGDDRG